MGPGFDSLPGDEARGSGLGWMGSCCLSLGAMTEASSLALLAGSEEAREEFRLALESKKTGRKVSVSWKTRSWFSFELLSWEFIQAARLAGRSGASGKNGGGKKKKSIKTGWEFGGCVGRSRWRKKRARARHRVKRRK